MTEEKKKDIAQIGRVTLEISGISEISVDNINHVFQVKEDQCAVLTNDLKYRYVRGSKEHVEKLIYEARDEWQVWLDERKL